MFSCRLQDTQPEFKSEKLHKNHQNFSVMLQQKVKGAYSIHTRYLDTIIQAEML